MTSLKKQGNSYKAYDSIYTMPIDIWLKVHDTSDLNLIMIEGNPSEVELAESWQKCYNEYISEFGVNEQFKMFLELKRQLIYATIDAALDPSSINTTLQSIAKHDHDTFFDNNEKVNFNLVYARVEKHIGFKLNRKETTVFDFYNYSRLLQEDIKEAQKHGRESN